MQVDVAMIAADTSRTRAYIRALCRHDFRPSCVLLLPNAGGPALPGQAKTAVVGVVEDHGALATDDWPEADFDPSEEIEPVLQGEGIPFLPLPSADVNDPAVIAALAARPETVFIYSGYGSVLLSKDLLECGKRFLHVHGGYLPDFKGSTTNYYSLIANGTMGASALFLVQSIDSGPVLLRKKFPPPPDRTRIDHVYDSAARAAVLVATIANYVETGQWETLTDSDGDGDGDGDGETFHIIHPVLKHIAIMASD